MVNISNTLITLFSVVNCSIPLSYNGKIICIDICHARLASNYIAMLSSNFLGRHSTTQFFSTDEWLQYLTNLKGTNDIRQVSKSDVNIDDVFFMIILNAGEQSKTYMSNTCLELSPLCCLCVKLFKNCKILLIWCKIICCYCAEKKSLTSSMVWQEISRLVSSLTKAQC